MQQEFAKEYKITGPDVDLHVSPAGRTQYDLHMIGPGESWMYYQVNANSLVTAVKKGWGGRLTVKRVSPVTCIVTRPQ
jgi:hypothetical protein